jgi:hypothetical protein
VSAAAGAGTTAGMGSTDGEQGGATDPVITQVIAQAGGSMALKAVRAVCSLCVADSALRSGKVTRRSLERALAQARASASMSSWGS